MKKNITINLCGRLFSIDEDAYEMLSTYEQSLRNYFRSHESGEEIVEDIEARIAELLYELKEQGTEAVTIENITEIIQRIGKPEEIDNLSPDPSPVSEGKSNGNENPAASPFTNGIGAKRLYRDPYDKKLMGVLSGIAAYFGIDSLWCRLGYVAAIILSFVGSTFNFLWWLPGQHFYFNIQFWGFALIIAYIVLSILMPVAWSPEDRLRMKGKPINPQNLADEIANPTVSPNRQYGESFCSNRDSKAPAAPIAESKGRGCLGCIGGFFTTLWAVITLLFRGCIYTFGVFVTIMCIVGIICLAAFGLNTADIVSMLDIPQPEEFTTILLSMKVPFYIFFISAITVLSITAYAIIHSLLNEFKQMPAMPYRQRIILLVIWIVCVIMAGSAIVFGVPKFIKGQKEIAQTEIEMLSDETDYYIGDVENEPNYSKGKGWLIQNKGLGILRIDSTYVSNDCVKLYFPRSKEVGPNEYLPIRAMLEPEKDKQGDFVYTIKVFGNFPESPLVLSLAGTFQIPDTVASCTVDTISINAEEVKETANTGGQEANQRINNRRVVRVRPGDTIGTIAKRNHTSVSEIRRLNRLRNDRLRVGQVLRVK